MVTPLKTCSGPTNAFTNGGTEDEAHPSLRSCGQLVGEIISPTANEGRENFIVVNESLHRVKLVDLMLLLLLLLGFFALVSLVWCPRSHTRGGMVLGAQSLLLGGPQSRVIFLGA